jgi:putative mRNA 3-end processing factor
MLSLTAKGLYCPYGDFYIDPSGKVDRAVITHAHSDHARRGSLLYYTTKSGEALLRTRLGAGIRTLSFQYGEAFRIGDVTVSFHPAGHILGSAQIRLERSGEVWVASGDYKRDWDPTCEPFEVVPCDVFITEATFGTPSFRWRKEADLGQEIFDWWQINAGRGQNSVLIAYSLGKTQRVLGVLYPHTEESIICHPAARELIQCYRNEGVDLAATACLSEMTLEKPVKGRLFIGPQNILDEKYQAIIGENPKTAFASGWMAQRQQKYDRGFVMSDHADWDDLVMTIEQTGARRVYVQHRGAGALVKHLRHLGLDAHPDTTLATPPHQAMQLAFGGLSL